MARSDSLLIYLAGHIHGGWRERVRQMCEERNLPVIFKGPCEDHGRSDAIGVETQDITQDNVGSSDFFSRVQDDLGGRINDLRTGIWISKCDVLIAFFDEEQKGLRQWNTASDIAEAARHGKPVIVVHGPGFRHSLKEVDGRAHAVVETLEQAVEVLAYICEE